MMQKFLSKITTFFKDKTLRKRFLFVVLFLALSRLLASIPIPGIDSVKLAGFLANNQFFGALNVFSGGGLSTFSIVMLGVGPYITASIIMQLATMMSSRLKSMYQEEGEQGRLRFANYTRLMTVPLAVIQGYSLMLLLQKQGILDSLTAFDKVVALSVITAGSLLMMWLGELLSEFGIGNGVSMLIFAGIVAQVPTHVSQGLYSYDSTQLPTLIAFLVVGLLTIAGVVFVTEAERLIPVTYARQVRGDRLVGGNTDTHIPLKLNQAGVIPIIFALSILMFPQLIANLLSTSTKAWAVSVSHGLQSFIQNTWLYALVYFVLVVLFTYFYTAVTFDPKQMSENLQKSGAFIPGIRPGESTMKFLANIVTRITLFGALFLGIIAVLPLVIRAITGITAIALGGTALLIVVSVVLDLIKRIDAQLSLREY